MHNPIGIKKHILAMVLTPKYCIRDFISGEKKFSAIISHSNVMIITINHPTSGEENIDPADHLA